MITYEKGDIKFNYRVGAIIYNPSRTKVLVLQTPGSDFCALPGGRVEELESSEAAIIRELREEMNFNAQVKLIKTVESFFVFQNKKYHELANYFVVTKINSPGIFNQSEFIGNEPKDYFKWVDLHKLNEIDLRPDKIKQIIINQDFNLEHIVLNELG